jgi:hypothetical protein
MFNHVQSFIIHYVLCPVGTRKIFPSLSFILLLFHFLFLNNYCQAQTTFGAQQIINNNADNAKAVYAADLDGDGDNDALFASRGDNTIAWHTNNGIGNFGAKQIISTNANGASAVYATDLNGDGITMCYRHLPMITK